jgi:hypothetical protein
LRRPLPRWINPARKRNIEKEGSFMERIISICLALSVIMCACLFAACSDKPKEQELTEAQKFASQIIIEMPDEVPLDDGKITFKVNNTSDKNCYILGPLGSSMLLYRFSTNPDIFTYMANSYEYYDRDYTEGCEEFEGREYLTVPAGSSVEFTFDGEWFVGYSYNIYKISLTITDDVTDGIFESVITKEFELA